ncbi:aryl-sulfate sulfotransferase [Aeromonas hydrophila]|uniref:aryl-sulfate sulfotransferase n=1 Tax=Aeromonas hydrophila TaxID=644 RepID=UPI00214EAD97|nr:aryl-sulfate sulfotransferase [Aeromonas hydrophila]MCR3951823.1 aryl-sulfate sulfotransferase [Aeromonas hydrophila]MCW4616737.1 aryl-sulfate sulfotransferase [Aeromonas hydrophila]
MMMKHAFLLSLVCTGLYGCNGSGGSSKTLAEQLDYDPTTQVIEDDIHASVFISALDLIGLDTSKIKNISFNIKTKEGNHAKSVSATYDWHYLSNNSLYDTTSNRIQIPIFGLYSNYLNELTINIQFTDNSTYSFKKTIATAAYIDSIGIYDNVDISIKPSATPTYSYFYLKGSKKSPIIMDIDGEVRWDADIIKISASSTFIDNSFLIGNSKNKKIDSINLYGRSSSLNIEGSVMGSDAYFHHNIDPGKQGILIELDGTTDGALKIESFLSEIDSSGKVIKEWDLGKIFSEYMLQEGDDPSNFVRDGVDWFHMNAATYDPADDTLVISSRENFVVKLDYATGKLIWLLGDETKHWYTYPSLQKIALSLSSGQTPIGQHAVSMTKDGKLMLFNNGRRSFNNPAGTPTGIDLATSQTAIFAIDNQNKTAQVAWSFDDGIYSDICSSIYEDKLATQGDFLINYAAADNRTKVVIQGINKDKQKLFEFTYPSPTPCATSWNAIQIPLENIHFQ